MEIKMKLQQSEIDRMYQSHKYDKKKTSNE